MARSPTNCTSDKVPDEATFPLGWPCLVVHYQVPDPCRRASSTITSRKGGRRSRLPRLHRQAVAEIATHLVDRG